MADVAWSDKRRALIPGEYKDGKFVPFNGDDPIPQAEVFASKPPLMMPVERPGGTTEMVTIAQAFSEAHQQDMARTGAFLKWGAYGTVILILVIILLNSPMEKSPVRVAPPLIVVDNDYGSLDLSPAMSGLGTMTKAAFGPAKSDCSSNEKLVVDLTKVLNRTVPSSRLVGFGVKTVTIQDGTAKLVGLAYDFEPGDKGVTETAIDYYLVNDACKVVFWAP